MKKNGRNNSGQQKMDRADVHQAKIWRRQGKTRKWIAAQFRVSKDTISVRTRNPAGVLSNHRTEMDWERTWNRVLAAHEAKTKAKGGSVVPETNPGHPGAKY